MFLNKYHLSNLHWSKRGVEQQISIQQALFLSQKLSRAILLHDIWKPNEIFPMSPCCNYLAFYPTIAVRWSFIITFWLMPLKLSLEGNENISTQPPWFPVISCKTNVEMSLVWLVPYDMKFSRPVWFNTAMKLIIIEKLWKEMFFLLIILPRGNRVRCTWKHLRSRSFPPAPAFFSQRFLSLYLCSSIPLLSVSAPSSN